jgi:biotin carboxylase
MRSHDISRIAPLDDYDVEIAAMLREHLRLPGMGESTARHFRDKLAMRTRAKSHGIAVPPFTPILNHDRLRAYFEEVPGPWLLKPRSEASSVGIRKLQTKDDIWPILDELGDNQSFYLVEKMIPGDVFHVDAITWEGQVVFAEAHRYRRPLLEVAHGGGIFATRTVDRGSVLESRLLAVHRQVIEGLRFVRGVTHTEFIHGHDGRFYFLETASRVGGAFIVDVIAAATGLNLWHEWAKLEIAGEHGRYEVPAHREDYAGLVLSLARQEHPDTSAYDDPEIAQRIDLPHHAGLIVRASSPEIVQARLESYASRFLEDFYASAPAPDRASH